MTGREGARAIVLGSVMVVFLRRMHHLDSGKCFISKQKNIFEPVARELNRETDTVASTPPPVTILET